MVLNGSIKTVLKSQLTTFWHITRLIFLCKPIKLERCFYSENLQLKVFSIFLVKAKNEIGKTLLFRKFVIKINGLLFFGKRKKWDWKDVFIWKICNQKVFPFLVKTKHISGNAVTFWAEFLGVTTRDWLKIQFCFRSKIWVSLKTNFWRNCY